MRQLIFQLYNSRNCQLLWSHWSVIVLWISFVLFYTISKLFPLQFTPINMSLFTPFSPYMLKRAILLLTCENLLLSSQRCTPFLLFELLTFLLTRITNYCTIIKLPLGLSECNSFYFRYTPLFCLSLLSERVSVIL